MEKTLIVIAGPTASGKTGLAVGLAQLLGTGIVSADSRQVFKEMRIGTAVPSADELSRARHFLIGHRSIFDPYDVSVYEKEALQCIEDIHGHSDTAILCGGTGLYLDAVCKGFDELPPADPAYRHELEGKLNSDGIGSLREELRRLDPEYYSQVDIHNPVRLIRALEVIRQAGRPYSELRAGKPRERPFRTLKYLLGWPREELNGRIGDRVDRMMGQGLLEEARALYPHRGLNALRTVGYRELFDHFDGHCTLAEAVAKIKTNTRRYAKRQVTWFRRDPAYIRLDGRLGDSLAEEIMNHIGSG